MKLVFQKFWLPITSVCACIVMMSIGLAQIARYIGVIVDVMRSGDDAYKAIFEFACFDLLLIINGITAWIISRYYRPKLYEFIILYMAQHVLYKDKQYFQENSAGEVLHAITHLARVTGAIIRYIPWFLFIIFYLSTTVLMCFNSHRSIGLCVSLWIVVYIAINIFFGLRGGYYSVQFTEASIKISGAITDVVENIHYIHAGYLQDHEIKELSRHMERPKREFYNVETTFIYGNTFQVISLLILDIIVYISCIGLLQSGSITIGDVSQFTVLSAGMHNMLYSTTRDVGDFVENIASYRGCIDIIGEKSMIECNSNQNPSLIGFGDIKIHNLKLPGLFHNLNLHIKPGETIGLVGRSGTGKTTLMNMLIRDGHAEYSGDILIDGHNVKSTDLRSLRSAFAVVPQNIRLFRRSLRENIAYGVIATDEEVYEAAKHAYIDNIITKLPNGYNTIIGDEHKLSGGQEQRVILARAFLRLSTAKILLIDEGTSALDSSTEAKISMAIRNLVGQRNITTIVIAHRLSTIKECDRIFELGDCKIQEVSYDDVMNKSMKWV